VSSSNCLDWEPICSCGVLKIWSRKESVTRKSKHEQTKSYMLNNELCVSKESVNLMVLPSPLSPINIGESSVKPSLAKNILHFKACVSKSPPSQSTEKAGRAIWIRISPIIGLQIHLNTWLCNSRLKNMQLSSVLIIVYTINLRIKMINMFNESAKKVLSIHAKLRLIEGKARLIKVIVSGASILSKMVIKIRNCFYNFYFATT